MSAPASTRPVWAQAAALAGFLVATFATGALGAIASINAPVFYAQLAKPTWAPPAGVFGPVWTVLYILMGVAAWLVWRATTDHRRALGLFAAQLVANALWSWLFFGWKQGALASIEVLVLLGLIVATMVAFWRVSRLAAALLVPYAAWVSFASALTWTVWRANPGLL